MTKDTEKIKDGEHIVLHDGEKVKIFPTSYINAYEALEDVKKMFTADDMREMFPENVTGEKWVEIRSYEGGLVWARCIISLRDYQEGV